MATNLENIIWADLEYTNVLDWNHNSIIQMACIATDKHLNILGQSERVIVRQSEECLSHASDWTKENQFWQIYASFTGRLPPREEIETITTYDDLHNSQTVYRLCDIYRNDDLLLSGISKFKSSLTEELYQKSFRDLPLNEAESYFMGFIHPFITKGKNPLAGNSIHFDRKLLEIRMPTFVKQLGYRIVDVTSFKEMISRWYLNAPKYVKKESHDALIDIQESIEELKFYQDQFFVKV